MIEAKPMSSGRGFVAGMTLLAQSASGVRGLRCGVRRPESCSGSVG
jgi:hypothetical protein